MTKFFTLILCCFLSAGAFCKDVDQETIDEDNPKYSIKIVYPQNFTPAINTAVTTFVTDQKNSFLSTAGKATDLPADAPGKDGLDITYKVVFQNDKVISLLFDLSIYDRGAAHPRNSQVSWNFINDIEVKLDNIFVPGNDYMSFLAHYCSAEFLKKDISEKNWIMEGTAPKPENYKIWHFSKKGLVIVFDTYQVAAYVFGPQPIEIPRSVISKYLQPDVVKAVWG